MGCVPSGGPFARSGNSNEGEIMFNTYYEELVASSYAASKEEATGEAVDARLQGAQFQLCTNAGHHSSADGKTHCKHFVKSQNRTCCMWYNDKIKDTEDTYKADKKELAICTKRKDRS